MLEAAVRDGFHDLRLKEEIAKAGAVYTDVAAFALGGAGTSHSEVALLGFAVSRGWCSCGRVIGGLELFVGVVDQVFFAGCHGGEWVTWAE